MMVESVLEEEEVVYYNYSQKSSRNSTFSCIAMAYSITFYKNHSIDKDGAGDVIIIFLKKLAVSWMKNVSSKKLVHMITK